MNTTTEGWELRITEMDLFTGLDLNANPRAVEKNVNKKDLVPW